MRKPWFKFIGSYLPYPISWKGYSITATYLLMAFIYAARTESGEGFFGNFWGSIFPVAVLTFIYLIFAYNTSNDDEPFSTEPLSDEENEQKAVSEIIKATNNLPMLAPLHSEAEAEIVESQNKTGEDKNKGTEEVVISIKNLTKSFKEVKVLDGINLEVKKGTMLALLGPNGAGKTTMVRILSTLLTPDGGTVTVGGADVKNEGNVVRANIGLTGQYAAVDEYLTGRENLNMMGALYHLSRKDALRRTDELLREFDLVDAADRIVKTYSGGMRRRLDLAASLISTPPILFLDEPTTGLDPRSRLKIWEIVGRLLDDGTTILLTTQYLEEADKLADKIAVLHHGKIIAYGTSDELKRKVGDERLEVTLKTNDDFKIAKAALGEGVNSTDAEERKISITTGSSVEDIKKILDKLEKEGVSMEGFSLHKPTLDDVFLELTGSSVEEIEKE